MNTLDWTHVVDRPNERLEFGASHVRHAWRRHKSSQSKFLGLESAFKTSGHRLPLLLQAVDSNYNARNHPERGQALFAAVWFSTSAWGILCNSTHATLVRCEDLEALEEQKTRSDETVAHLASLFDATPLALHMQLDESFFDRVLCRE